MTRADLVKCYQRGICMEDELEVLARNITRDYSFLAQIGVVIYLEWIPEWGRYEIERLGPRPAPDE